MIRNKKYDHRLLLHEELEPLQVAISKYDSVSTNIKAFVIALFVGVLVIVPNIKNPELVHSIILFVASVIIFACFFLEKKYRYYQKKFELRMSLITLLHNTTKDNYEFDLQGNNNQNHFLDNEKFKVHFDDLKLLSDYNKDVFLKVMTDGPTQFPKYDIAMNYLFLKMGLSKTDKENLLKELTSKSIKWYIRAFYIILSLVPFGIFIYNILKMLSLI